MKKISLLAATAILFTAAAETVTVPAHAVKIIKLKKEDTP